MLNPPLISVFQMMNRKNADVDLTKTRGLHFWSNLAITSRNWWHFCNQLTLKSSLKMNMRQKHGVVINSTSFYFAVCKLIACLQVQK